MRVSSLRVKSLFCTKKNCLYLNSLSLPCYTFRHLPCWSVPIWVIEFYPHSGHDDVPNAFGLVQSNRNDEHMQLKIEKTKKNLNQN